ncbi:hypothetical protein LTR03_018294, partial [Friedmanniomyces endolithicus]
MTTSLRIWLILTRRMTWVSNPQTTKTTKDRMHRTITKANSNYRRRSAKSARRKTISSSKPCANESRSTRPPYLPCPQLRARRRNQSAS